MKYIDTKGGPVIGLHRDALKDWAGVSGSIFFHSDMSQDNDYKRACNYVHPLNQRPNHAEVVCGAKEQAILFSYPYQTAIIDVRKDSIGIAQAIYAEPEWNFDSVDIRLFDQAALEKSTAESFKCFGGTIVLFDAAFCGNEILDNCLTFDLPSQYYDLRAGAFNPDDEDGFILYRLIGSRKVLFNPQNY